ncbi:MAG: O-antigen ligase family protein [Variibacter sp.]
MPAAVAASPSDFRAPQRPTHAPRLATSLERLRGAVLWLMAFSGAFVFMEPSPYEITSILAIIVFVITGLSLRAAIMPLVIILTVYNIGFSIAVIPVLGEPKTLMWVLISWFMSATAIFFAAVLGKNTESRLALIVKGYMAAGVVASLAGIIGYFHIIPKLSDLFLRYERARGTFNDPNVLGAFLIFPALIALQRVLSGRTRDIFRSGIVLMILVVALLLSFSRAAWGQFAVTAVLMVAMLFVTSRSRRERTRLVALSLAGAGALVLLIAALLSIGSVSTLFEERASLEQSYDSGHTGRFGRHILGFLLALDRPIGIGPLQFAHFFPEDPHNAYLNSFMSGGWISGICYFTLVLTTIVIGYRTIFIATPWRKTYLAFYAAFLGVAGESTIIDSDHWRHYFLILGVLWGLICASQPYARRQRATEGQHAAPPAAAPLAPSVRAS